MNSLSEPRPPFLEASQVSMVFDNQNGGLQVLKRLNFAVQDGQFVAILGPSGCGKTTLLRLMAGLLEPSEGQMLFRGNPIIAPVPDAGIVFQKANLMPWRSTLENILLPLEIRGIPSGRALAAAKQMITRVRLEGFEETLPRDLSGGMAQRVAIARALIQDPGLLLLDEPFGSLDALTREKMGLELLRIWQEHRITAILVTHSISEAILLADRVLVLTPRPGQVQLDLTVTLPRPRQRDMRYTHQFSELSRRLRSAILDTQELSTAP